jgi:hypothetical protein
MFESGQSVHCDSVTMVGRREKIRGSLLCRVCMSGYDLLEPQ